MFGGFVDEQVILWLKFQDVLALSMTSKTIKSRLDVFVGPTTDLFSAISHLNITQTLVIKIQSLRKSSTSDDNKDIFLKNTLKFVISMLSGIYDVKPQTMKKLFSLCPKLEILEVYHPTTALINRIKSLKFLIKLTIGKVGFSNTKCSDECCLHMLSAVGSQLVELKFVKLNCLTTKVLGAITQHCKKIEKLSIISCNGVRATSVASNTEGRISKVSIRNNSVFSNCTTVNHMIEAIGHSIREIDLRYSIEMNDGYLDVILENVPQTNLRVFTASRTTLPYESKVVSTSRFNVSSCGIPDDAEEVNENCDTQNLTTDKWATFVEFYGACAKLLYIDNIGNEGGNGATFLFMQCKNRVFFVTQSFSNLIVYYIDANIPCLTLQFYSLSVAKDETKLPSKFLEKVIIQLDDNLFKAKKRLSVSPTVDSTSTATIIDGRQCNNIVGCVECSASQLDQPEMASNIVVCASRVTEGSIQSDGGFIDDADDQDWSLSEEGFTDEADPQSGTFAINQGPLASCACMFLPVILRSRVHSNLIQDTKHGKISHHVARNATLIRLS